VPCDGDVAVVVLGVAPVLADGPLLLSAEEAAAWGGAYR
jgi:hypothetical protein